MTSLFILFESASGYALFERTQMQEAASLTDEIQNAITEYAKFKAFVNFKAFVPFTSAENALENINMISEGLIPDLLKGFLEMNLPKKKSQFTLGVLDDKLGSAVQDILKVNCERVGAVQELSRGIRWHFSSFIKELKEKDLEKAQLGLGHSYSRSKVKFNIHRVDNMIIQAIALLDQLDKDVNTFSMRVREWYSWHFPELVRIVPDNYKFARLVQLVGNKSSLSDASLDAITEIVDDPDKGKEILDAAKTSMGTDISEIDLRSIEEFTKRVISLTEYRLKLHKYLSKKMSDCAPNLAQLMGELVGARLIARAGSLTNLAKYPASTVQILGAEKALFRALKTKGNTPKYGLIYHSSFIQKAGLKHKGRISRYLANKASLASRIDSFSENPTTIYGTKLREQVEERLEFYEKGTVPRKNVDVMREAMQEVAQELHANGNGTTPSKKRKAEDSGSASKKTPKKAKKDDTSSSESSEDEKAKKKAKKAKKEKTPKKSKKVESSSESSSSSEEDKKSKKKKKTPKK